MMDGPGVARQPFLLRAMHEWITFCQHTPYIVVDATMHNVEVPRQHVKGGRITLNISYKATSGLRLANDAVSFRARFEGVTYNVNMPVAAVLGIYASETGQGLIFSEADLLPPNPPPPTSPGSEPGDSSSDTKRPKPRLKVVK
jgi:stringent starvation protein B